jgi:hypothetical protein
MNQETFNLWSLIIQIVASLGAILTLILIWKQVKLAVETVKHDSKSLEVTTFHAAALNLLEIGKLFIDRPQFRKYFYDGVPVAPDSPDREGAKALAVVMMDFLSDLLVYANQYPHLYSRQTLFEYVADMFKSSPIMCETLTQLRQEGKKWYTDEFYNIMLNASVCAKTAAVEAAVRHEKPSVPQPSATVTVGPGQS